MLHYIKDKQEYISVHAFNATTLVLETIQLFCLSLTYAMNLNLGLFF